MQRPLLLQDVIANLQGGVTNALNNQVTAPSGPNAAFAYEWETAPSATDSVTTSVLDTSLLITVDATAAYNVPSSNVSTYPLPLTLAQSGELIVAAWAQQGGLSTIYTPSISDNFSTRYTWNLINSVSFTTGAGVYAGIYMYVGTGGAGTTGTVTFTTTTAQQATAVAASFRNATGYGENPTAAGNYNSSSLNPIVTGVLTGNPFNLAVECVRMYALPTSIGLGWPYTLAVAAMQSGTYNLVLLTAPRFGFPSVFETYGNTSNLAWGSVGVKLT
jgi:hypothetical protein